MAEEVLRIQIRLLRSECVLSRVSLFAIFKAYAVVIFRY